MPLKPIKVLIRVHLMEVDADGTPAGDGVLPVANNGDPTSLSIYAKDFARTLQQIVDEVVTHASGTLVEEPALPPENEA